MKYNVTTWETLECTYEVEATSKDDAWERVLDNEGKQTSRTWKENGSYIVEPEFPGNVVDFKTKVLEIMKKKPIDKEK